jgi:hypothetical protein
MSIRVSEKTRTLKHPNPIVRSTFFGFEAVYDFRQACQTECVAFIIAVNAPANPTQSRVRSEEPNGPILRLGHCWESLVASANIKRVLAAEKTNLQKKGPILI